MHFRIALAVLGRRWRGDQRSVDDSAFAHHQAFLGQVPVNRVEDLARQPLGFKQVAELQQGRRVRRRFAAQVDADESTMQLATRRYAVYLREETVTPRQLLLGTTAIKRNPSFPKHVILHNINCRCHSAKK